MRTVLGFKLSSKEMFMPDPAEERLDYRPIESTPGLFGFYGCGLRLYGSRDKDADTSSHVATRFMTVVFFPLFAIDAYRITKTEEGSFFLGATGLSRVTRGWNYLVLVALLVLGGLGYWQSYLTSPEYIAGENLALAEAAVSEGRIGDAAELLEKVSRGNTSHAESAGTTLRLLVDTAKLRKASAAQTLKAINVFKRARSTKPLVFDAVWPLVEEGVETDPVATRQLLESIADLGPDDGLVARTHIALLERLVAGFPDEQEYAIELALFYESEDRFDELEPLLAPHTQTLDKTEGARILGQQYAYENRIQASYDLLLPYTTAKLEAFHRAEKRYSAAVDQVWDETVKYLNDGKAAKKFYRAYDEASQARQQQMVDEEFVKRRDRSPIVKKALANYQDAADIVPVALDMGLVMLRRAQTLADADERQRELELAEETFLSIRGVAGESDKYRMYLAQVYYWLGRPEEGKNLFDELLEARGRDFDTMYSVSSLLRDLGDQKESRALMLELYDQSQTQEEKYTAADFLSLLAYELDERIEWLKLADPNNARIQADLNNLLGLEAEYAQDFAEAERYYTLAVQAYEAQTKNATNLNNLALSYFSLYRVGRDQVVLDKGVASMDEAIALDPSSSIILLNAASELVTAGCEDLIGDTFSLEKLKTRGYLGLLAHLYDDETEKLALGERLKNHPAIKKATSYLEKAMILAPKNPTPYTELSGLYYFMYDLEGLQRVAGQLEIAELDLSDAKVDHDAYYMGETDVYSIDYHNTRIEELRHQLDTLDPKSFTHVVVSSFLVSSYFSLDILDHPVDVEWIVNTTRRNQSIAPSSSTRSDYRAALLVRATERLRIKSEELNDLAAEFGRGFSRHSLLAVAMERWQSVRQLAIKDPDVVAYASLMKESFERYPFSETPDEWAFFRSWDQATADQIAQSVVDNHREDLDLKVNSYLNPPNPSSTYNHYWKLKLAGEEASAIEVLRQAAASGIKIPAPN